VFSRGRETHRGRAFLRQLQVDAGGREVNQFAGGVECEVHCVLVAEFLEFLRVVAVYPASGGHLDRLERGIDAVFVLQPVGDDVELQRAHRTQDQVVGHERAEELGRAFLAQLRQAFLQLLELERNAQASPAE
jgi:hypothetical protein